MDRELRARFLNSLTYCHSCYRHLGLKCDECKAKPDVFYKKEIAALLLWRAEKNVKPIRVQRVNSKYKPRPWVAHSHRLVKAAIKAGVLPDAKTLQCVDCKRHAKVYDHRFYSEPLLVQPVCLSCNARRGTAWDEALLRAELEERLAPAIISQDNSARHGNDA